MRRSHVLLTLALTSPLALVACSPASNTGGTGGAPSGGTSSGGTSSGGAASGGTASGGTSSGGTASGGTASGGTASGGAGTGGATGGAGTGGATGGAATGGTGTGGASGEFTLTSDELAEGAAFPEANTCAGGGGAMGFGAPLPFEWENPPAGTMSYAMVMLDDTLVGEGSSFGYHSAFWNVPATVTSLPAGFGVSALMGGDEINDGYLGPCPSGELHTYTFTLYALDTEEITLGGTLNAAFIDTLEAAAIGTATLSGTSDAQM